LQIGKELFPLAEAEIKNPLIDGAQIKLIERTDQPIFSLTNQTHHYRYLNYHAHK